MVSTRRIAGLLLAAVAARALPGEISQDGSARGGPMVADAPITPPTSCAAGVQIFVVRGSTEPSHMGRIAPVATSIRDAVPGSFITALDYPAKINAAQYFFSVHRGVSRLAKLVRDYVKMCPQGKIALVGYSQGAHVVGDLVCGASSLPLYRSKPLDPVYNKNSKFFFSLPFFCSLPQFCTTIKICRQVLTPFPHLLQSSPRSSLATRPAAQTKSGTWVP